MDSTALIIALLAGVLLDRLLGDPQWLPHPVVGFGKAISWFEHRLNKGGRRVFKGAFTAVFLIAATFLLAALMVWGAFCIHRWLGILFMSVSVFFCLAGKTLEDEVAAVFQAADRSLDEGRRQVSRIVGRDTEALSDQEVRTAALETLAENLSDGVIAPLFWFLVAGVPGMFAYKMVNTLDSMIGYRNDRYLEFGRWAARIDDVANYIPARLTAFWMVLASGRPGLLRFVREFGPEHASPNSGYPESALAGILDCRFGGPHDYFGKVVYKPFIGRNDRRIETRDMLVSLRINRLSELLMVLCMLFVYACIFYFYGNGCENIIG